MSENGSNKKIVYYFDLDGVTYKWKIAPFQITKTPGYFFNLEKDPKIHEAVLIMAERGYDVRFLTAYYTDTNAKEEKKNSLKRDKLEHIPAIYVPYGDDKFKYIEDESACNILVDDYSKNLHSWSAHGGIGIKYYNGFNGHNGTWNSFSVNMRMSVDDIVTTIVGIAEAKAAGK